MEQKGKGKGKKSGRKSSRGKSAVADKPKESNPPDTHALQEATAAQEAAASTMSEGPAKELLIGQIKQLRAQQQALKPPTLWSQLNSAEARVKKATQRRHKLALTLEDTKKQIDANNEELKQASATLEEVKGLLKGTAQDGQPANQRAKSQEPAVADVTSGVCKELAQILTTLQLSIEASTADTPTSLHKDRSRSNSRE
eukprot:2745956-Amphidinium_carterae.1